MTKSTKHLTKGAIIASLYVILTVISAIFGLSNGAVQLRLSESLYCLAVFTPDAVLGLFIGCLLSNILCGAVLYDVIFGSIATLIGAFFARKLRNQPILALLPPIISNTVIIPFVLRFAYGISGSIPYLMAAVGLGEFLSCGILGYILYKLLKKTTFLI